MADPGIDRDLRIELGRVIAAVDGVARIEPTLRSALAAVASGVASGVAAGAGRVLPGRTAPTASAPTASAPTASAPTASAPTASAPTASAPTLGIDIDTRPGAPELGDQELFGVGRADRVVPVELAVLTDVTVDIATWPTVAAVVVARDARAAVRAALLGRGRHPGHVVINVMDVLPAGPGRDGSGDS